MMRAILIVLALILLVNACSAFQRAPTRLSSVRKASDGLRMSAPEAVPAVFQGAYEPVYNYVNFWVKTGMFDIAPDWLM